MTASSKYQAPMSHETSISLSTNIANISRVSAWQAKAQITLTLDTQAPILVQKPNIAIEQEISLTFHKIADFDTVIPGHDKTFNKFRAPSIDKGNVAFAGGHGGPHSPERPDFRYDHAGVYTTLGGGLNMEFDAKIPNLQKIASTYAFTTLCILLLDNNCGYADATRDLLGRII